MLNIRPAAVDDAAAVLEIERACAEAPHWSEGIWAQVLSSQDSQYRLKGPQRQCFVAEQAGKIVGFIVVGVIGAEAELESVTVAESLRRCGVGSGLCLYSFLWAEMKGAGSMQLEVRSASVAAVALYQSLGFVEQGRRKGYYREPLDDALLMRAPLMGQAAKV